MQEETPTEVELRSSSERPVYKLSVRLIDTYKYINKVYYEAKAAKLRDQRDTARGGVHNDGYDDQNYDYILKGDEIMNDRYIIKHKMGKGSFGQVVCAYDQHLKTEVAIKIIKSRRPFLIQAKTEIDILNKVSEKDENDESNIVRLLDQFIYRNHQCLVFEILSFNLYELLKNTKFRGVSLSLIRKFSRHLLKSLEFLSRPDVDIIHCDLKPENILLKNPRRSAIKLIDFGSSCYLTKRAYSYIQSRFYRSPEVLLGLPYTQKIDMWSLGCVCMEMHTGEPLFGGANQADQICRIVDVLGMFPVSMIKASPEKVRSQFFERVPKNADPSSLPGICDLSRKVEDDDGSCYYVLKRHNRDGPRPRTLEEIVGAFTGGPAGRRMNEPDHSSEKYLEFLDFIKMMLIYEPTERANPTQMLSHPYLAELNQPPGPAAAGTVVAGSGAAAGAALKSAAEAAAQGQGQGQGQGAAGVAGGAAMEVATSEADAAKIRPQSAPGGYGSTAAASSSWPGGAVVTPGAVAGGSDAGKGVEQNGHFPDTAGSLQPAGPSTGNMDTC